MIRTILIALFFFLLVHAGFYVATMHQPFSEVVVEVEKNPYEGTFDDRLLFPNEEVEVPLETPMFSPEGEIIIEEEEDEIVYTHVRLQQMID